jgi:GTP cyclohydrolase I
METAMSTNGSNGSNGHIPAPTGMLVATNGSIKGYDKASLPDIHAVEDTRGLAINRVGIDGVAFPMVIKRKTGGEIQTVGTFDMYGSLDPMLKGTNMSRFAELLLDHGSSRPLSGYEFPDLLLSLAKRLEASDVYIKSTFNFWMNKTTPVSKRESPMSYECAFIGQLTDNKLRFVVEFNVPIATYCPCSKAMCVTDAAADVGKGAHAQRGLVTLQVRTDPNSPGAWLEDLIRISETSGSAELYTLLKRPDEKYVTIQGYENPKFVEDVARDVMRKIHNLPEAIWAKVRVRNFESIHHHNATAYISQKKVAGNWTSLNRAFY